MGMVMGLVTLSDANVERVVGDPPLAWLLVAPDDRAPYDEARAATASRPGLLSRLLGKKPVPVPDLVKGESEGAEVDLDKAWHGIHYLLTGSAWAGSAPQAFLLAGGRTAGDLEIGYAPVRLHTSTEVQAFQEYLAKVDDQELRARFDPGEMAKLEIYPDIWDPSAEEEDTLGYLMEYLAMLRDFIKTAASKGMGVAISLT